MNQVVDLSHSMAIRVSIWEKLHKLNTDLLFNCGYYPRGGCQDCSFTLPNPSCKFSHILLDTRPGTPYIPNQLTRRTQAQAQTKKKRDKTAWGISIEKILPKLPPHIREEILRLMEGR